MNNIGVSTKHRQAKLSSCFPVSVCIASFLQKDYYSLKDDLTATNQEFPDEVVSGISSANNME